MRAFDALQRAPFWRFCASGPPVPAGPGQESENSDRAVEPADWPRRLTPSRREDFMTDNDATVLAKFVFVVFGLGLTGMVAQLIMLG
jgi:hypothetical protein